MTWVEWKVVGTDFPPNDRTLVCINENLDFETLTLCYFDGEIDGFIPLFNAQPYSIVVTHWIEIPPFPGEELWLRP